MKIAFVNDAIYPFVKGGVERRIYELASRLDEQGHEVHLYGLQWWQGESTFSFNNVVVHGVGRGCPLYVRGRRSIPEAFRFSLHLLPCLLQEDYDLIDCQAAPYIPCYSSKTASILRKAPLVITWHEVWNEYWYEYLGRSGYAGRLIERMAAHLTHDHIAVSDSTRDGLRRLGVPYDIEVIPNGIDFEQIRQTPPARMTSDVIYVGRLIKEKNVDLLIRAVRLLADEDPEIRCQIIGDGPEYDRLVALAGQLDLSEEQVLFRGALEDHEDLIAALHASRVFVLPSVREGFGIVVLEANAAGLPVVTIDHPMNAARHLITGRNGATCALSDTAIASGISEMLMNGNAMRGDCIAFAERYNWDTIAGSLLSYYQGLAG